MADDDRSPRDRNPFATLSGVPFWRMDGLGNDFVILDLRGGAVLTADLASMIGDRAGPLGCDQIIGIVNDAGGVAMTIHNTDGSPAGACGNAARCVAALLMHETGTNEVRFGSPSGPLWGIAAADGQITVDMGPPRLGWQDIPLAEPVEDTRFVDIKLGPIDAPVLWGPSAVSMGNPHCVFFTDDIAAHDIGRFGPLVENHPLFPEGANVSVAEVRDEGRRILVRTWERGAGLTRACGTAACAALVCAVRRRLAPRESVVTLPGGDLVIAWDKETDRVLMTGPVRLSAAGHFPGTPAGGG